MDGEMIDFTRGVEVEARAAIERIIDWTTPARESLGLDIAVPSANGAQRARQAFAEGDTIAEIYRRALEDTRRTYVPEGVVPSAP
jgi:hypothetical protein